MNTMISILVGIAVIVLIVYSVSENFGGIIRSVIYWSIMGAILVGIYFFLTNEAFRNWIVGGWAVLVIIAGLLVLIRKIRDRLFSY